jgi:hypothetical protein
MNSSSSGSIQKKVLAAPPPSHLVAFSCKRRGFCPSCGARRMIESVAHLVDHVLPDQPIRQ